MADYKKDSSAIRKLLLGLFLICPNCEQGRFGRGLFAIQPQCPVCAVKYERQPGEGTGAMILTLSLMPIVSIILFFILWNAGVDVWVNAIISISSVIVLCLLVYRHMRGLWVAVTHLTGGLRAD